MGVIDIGATALNAAYTRLQTTSNNIANASTPGYSRQEAIVVSRESELGVGGFVGGGVEVATIERKYDQFLARELNASQSAYASDQVRSNSLARLDRLFTDNGNGIGARYDSFNAGLADMVNQPFDEAARAVVLHRAHELADSISGNRNELERVGEDVRRQAQESAGRVNGLLQQLAVLNERIAGTAGSSQSPNDMLDQRDSLITEIGKSIKTTAYINESGSVSLFAATGDALVISGKAAVLSVETDDRDPGRIRLNLQTDDRQLPMNVEMLGGGELAGIFEFHNEDLRDISGRLGQMAGALVEGYNRQQAAGVDREGQPGSPLFQMGAALVGGGINNTGDAVFSIDVADGEALKPTDYSLAMVAGNLHLTRLYDDKETVLTGLPQTVDGLTINLDAGTMADGDTFSIISGSVFASGFSVVMQSPVQWANAMPVIPVMNEGNKGSLSSADFAIVDMGANTAEPVMLTFTGPNTFDVTGTGTGNPTGVAYASGDEVSFNGWTVSLAGAPEGGDVLMVRPTADPAADNRNARALLALSGDAIVDGRSLNSAVSSLIGDVGARAQTANANQEQSELWTRSAQSARDSVSGVNLDEEAARLLQYQQVYQAAAKVISTAQTMFDSLLSIGR